MVMVTYGKNITAPKGAVTRRMMREEKWKKRDRKRAKARKWKPTSGRSVFLAVALLIKKGKVKRKWNS